MAEQLVLLPVSPEASTSGAPVVPERVGHAEIATTRARTIFTPSSGYVRKYRFTLNPYSGCAFACDYCYARAFTPDAEREAAWGQWVTVKENARALVERACRDGTLRDGDALYLSSVTDPYQPIEQRLGLTRSILEAILASGVQPRLTVQTRSPIVTRDADLLRQFTHVRVNFSITTDSEHVRLRYEPHAPAIRERLHAAERLVEAGVPIGVCVAPMLPVEDPVAFGECIGRLRAAEYVAQFFHTGPPRRYVTSTPVASFEKAREDEWTREGYRAARAGIAAGMRNVLGDEYALLEGSEGFSPAGMEQRQRPVAQRLRVAQPKQHTHRAAATRRPRGRAGSPRA